MEVCIKPNYVNSYSFTITGKEPKWIEFPSLKFGPMVDGDYQVQKVEGYPVQILHIQDLQTGTFEDTEMSSEGLVLGHQEDP